MKIVMFIFVLIAVACTITITAKEDEDRIITVQSAVEDFSTNVFIPCNLDRQYHPLYWNIQERVYDLENVPSTFEVMGHEGLRIPKVDRRMDGLLFQCFTIDFNREGNQNPGTVTQLTVAVINQSGITGDSDDIFKPSVQELVIAYQSSFYQSENVILDWLYSPDPTSPCYGSNSTKYQILLFSQSDIDGAENPQDLIAYQTFNATNTTVTLSRDENEISYIQISAYTENNAHCSNSMNFEKFENGETVDVQYDSENDIAMFILPDDLSNSRSLQLIWFKNNTTQCVCPPVEQLISRCACNMEYRSNKITIMNDNTIIVSNLSLGMDEIFLSFVSSLSSGCHGTCNLRSIMKLYRIVTKKGIPAAPIISRARWRTVCFNIPINSISAEEYRVNFIDNTGSQTKLSGTYDTVRCLTITTDLYPAVCGPFHLSVTAINTVGRVTTQQTIQTAHSGSTPCQCVKKKDSVHVNIIAESTGVIIEVNCKTQSEFILTLTRENSTNIRHVNTSCNVTQSFNSLQPSTNYTAKVFIKDCTLNNMIFKTNSGMNTLITGLIAGLVLVCFIALMVGVVAVLVVWNCNCNRGGYSVRTKTDVLP